MSTRSFCIISTSKLYAFVES